MLRTILSEWNGSRWDFWHTICAFAYRLCQCR